MARHRTYSIEFKRQVAQEFLGGESLNGLARRHDISRNLIRIWVAKYEAAYSRVVRERLTRDSGASFALRGTLGGAWPGSRP